MVGDFVHKHQTLKFIKAWCTIIMEDSAIVNAVTVKSLESVKVHDLTTILIDQGSLDKLASSVDTFFTDADLKADHLKDAVHRKTLRNSQPSSSKPCSSQK